jgi:hypothetical protein
MPVGSPSPSGPTNPPSLVTCTTGHCCQAIGDTPDCASYIDKWAISLECGQNLNPAGDSGEEILKYLGSVNYHLKVQCGDAVVEDKDTALTMECVGGG